MPNRGLIMDSVYSIWIAVKRPAIVDRVRDVMLQVFRNAAIYHILALGWRLQYRLRYDVLKRLQSPTNLCHLCKHRFNFVNKICPVFAQNFGSPLEGVGGFDVPNGGSTSATRQRR